MKLVEPSIKYKAEFLTAEKSRLKGENSLLPKGISLDEVEKDFPGFIQTVKDRTEGRSLPKGYVPSSVFWLVDKGEYIGQVSIRHRLTPHLKKIGGHVGYAISPTKRRRGYGTKILELALEKTQELGIDNVLVTCDATNVGSRKVIEKNRGKFRKKVPQENGKPHKLHFWIEQ